MRIFCIIYIQGQQLRWIINMNNMNNSSTDLFCVEDAEKVQPRSQVLRNLDLRKFFQRTRLSNFSSEQFDPALYQLRPRLRNILSWDMSEVFVSLEHFFFLTILKQTSNVSSHFSQFVRFNSFCTVLLFGNQKENGFN